jgi:hypothetical protein
MDMGKRGQFIFGMSYGVIFSIIIIIATIGVSVYAIIHFMSVNECAEIGMFYNDLEKNLDVAWKSGIYDDSFGEDSFLPSGIEMVCFGNLINPPAPGFDLIQQNLLGKYGTSSSNIFLEPADEACDMPTNHLKCGNSECMRVDGLFCVNVTNNKINIRLSKGTTESSVTVSA